MCYIRNKQGGAEKLLFVCEKYFKKVLDFL
nr:MAG TPA: hypothetical protein [Bacteriophage sp.]